MPKRKYGQYIAGAYEAYKRTKAFVRGVKKVKSAFRGRKSRKNSKSKRPLRRGNGNRIYSGDGASKVVKRLKYKVSRIAKDQKVIGGTYTFTTQSFSNLVHLGTDLINSQINRLIVPAIFNGEDTTSLMDQAYAQLATGHPLDSTVPLATNTSMKFLIKRCITTLRLVNHDKNATTVTLYILQAKTTSYDDQLDPLLTWAEGAILDESTNPGSANQIGARPTSHKLFNIHWKQIKKYTAVLQPGAQHTLVFDFMPMSIIDATYFELNGKVRGITHSILLSAHGMLAVGTAAAAEVVVPEPVNLLASVTKEYSIQPLNSFTTHDFYERDHAALTVAEVTSLSVFNKEGIEVV